MQAQPPHSSLWSEYSPGYWQQDLMTFPVEAGLAYVIPRYLTPRSEPLWPFAGESNTESMKSTTLPGKVITPYAAVWGVATYAGLKLFGEQFFELYPNLSGAVHTILLTNIATTFAKTAFQRHRPFYDTKLNEAHAVVQDDSYSFFSEHASQAFAWATYSTAMVYEYSGSNPYVGVIYGLGAYSAATYVAYSRVTDHAHHVSDIIAGAIVGTAIAAGVFYRVQQVIKDKNQQTESTVSNYSVSALPLLNDSPTQSTTLGLLLNINYDF